MRCKNVPAAQNPIHVQRLFVFVDSKRSAKTAVSAKSKVVRFSFFDKKHVDIRF